MSIVKDEQNWKIKKYYSNSFLCHFTNIIIDCTFYGSNRLKHCLTNIATITLLYFYAKKHSLNYR